jgi:hypothetical protein
MSKPRSLSEKGLRVMGLIATGHSYEEIVKLEQDVCYQDIFHAAEEALRLHSPRDFDTRMAEIKAQHPNAYERWVPEDDSLLAEMHKAGTAIEAMAERFRRQPSAIRSRLAKLELA